MTNRSMLKDIKLAATAGADLMDRAIDIQDRIEQQDKAVIDYINIRGKDREFKKKVQEALNKNKARRGPKPEGLPSIAFFELIKAIKKSYRLKSIGLSLETYCELYNLPIEKASCLEDKYRRGREELTKKGGVIQLTPLRHD